MTGLDCSHCGGLDNEVKDSRPTSHAIRRRRRCASCGDDFTTYELTKDRIEKFAMIQISNPLSILDRQIQEAIKAARTTQQGG
jgi:transcriptional regulator NrdR family protein